MKTLVYFSLVLTLAAAFNGTAVADYTFTVIDAPGAAGFTSASGINSTGQIVGSPGFVRDAGGSFTTIAVPGAAGTGASGINTAGQIVGFFSVPNGSGAYTIHGFFRDAGGGYSTFDYPGACDCDIGTQALGINDGGLIVGMYSDHTLPTRHGFLFQLGVSFLPFDVPGASEDGAFGVNNAGHVVGEYTDASAVQHGYLYTGSFVPIDAPGAFDTEAFGINTKDQIVGAYFNASGFHGFLDIGGAFTTIDAPGVGSGGTVATGINDAGQIVGSYFDTSGMEHGFLATPKSAAVPEPSSFLLLITAIAITSARFFLRKRIGTIS